MDTSAPASLVVFCDASHKAFGFAAFIFQSVSAGLIFSKAKVALLVKQTLSPLELLLFLL